MRSYTHKQMRERKNNFEAKYRNVEIITEKPNEKRQWEKSYKDWKKAQKRKYPLIHSDLLHPITKLENSRLWGHRWILVDKINLNL